MKSLHDQDSQVTAMSLKRKLKRAAAKKAEKENRKQKKNALNQNHVHGPDCKH